MAKILAAMAGVVMAVAAFATATGAGVLALSCTTPECIRGVPPMVVLAECSEPKCLGGTQPLLGGARTS
jgi:hypothetical protein